MLDSTLRLPLDSPVLGPEAATTIVTTARADPARRAALQERGARIEVVDDDRGRVDLAAALARLRRAGMESLLVEGGATVITSFLAAGLADRVIVAVAPIVLGRGTEAVDGLGITEVDRRHPTRRPDRRHGRRRHRPRLGRRLGAGARRDT